MKPATFQLILCSVFAKTWGMNNGKTHDEIVSKRRAYYQKTKSHHLKKCQEWAEKNRARSNAIKQAWKQRNRDKYLAQQREYAKQPDVSNRKREQLKSWRRDNNQRFRESSNIWREERRKSDPVYLAECKWRNRFNGFLKNKSSRSFGLSEVFGCGAPEFRKHIESQWLPGMTWENRWSVWQIDHIEPLRKFDLRDISQVKKAMHYSNTRPLWSSANGAQQGRREAQ